jgi:beta-glucosidase-like glycosyl hydrolase/CubicO group peptidase (beta-lactamase class C family)
VDRTIKSLSLREKIAQLVFVRVPGRFLNRDSEAFVEMRRQVTADRVGGLVLFSGNVYESTLLLNELQTISSLPLLVASDFERGAAFRIADTTSFPWAMALGATRSEQLSYEQGLVAAREARALGVHWIFAPVLDVNNNPENPVINIRALGEDPDLVARLGSAFIRGARTGGVLTTAKHFPGHGDTATDSHLGLAVVQSDRARLEAVELMPFKRAIEAGVDSVMTAHIAVPNITGEPKEPATLSSKILDGLLRSSMNFRGIIVTDALEMGGITNRYWCGLAAVRAIQAGTDVILLPPDSTVAISEVLRAVKRGDIAEARIDESVRRILEAKRRLGLQRNRLVAPNLPARIVGTPKSAKLAQDIADRSITVVKDEARVLPLDPARYPRIFNLVVSPDLESAPGAVFQNEMRRRFPLSQSLWANARIPDDLEATIVKTASEADLIVFSTLTRLTTGQSADPVSGRQEILFHKLIGLRKPLIWVAFGTPYIFKIAPQAGTYVCAFSYSESSQVAAAKAIAGEIEIDGRLPVSIPGYFKPGDGLTVPKLEMKLRMPPLTGHPEDIPDQCTKLLDSIIESGVLPGAQILVGRESAITLQIARGKTGFEVNSAAVSAKTSFNLGSMSPVVGLITAATMAAEQGSLLSNAPLEDYVPETRGTAAGKVRVQELLKTAAAQSGESAGVSEANTTLNSILLQTTGVRAQKFLAERLFKPLGMTETFFKPSERLRAPAESTEGIKPPELFSSAQNLAIYAQMLLNRGVYDHRRYLKMDTVDAISKSRGFWRKPSEADWTEHLFSSAAFGHLADSGSFLWIDPQRKMFAILLTNARLGDARVAEAQERICKAIVASIPD